MKTRYTHAGLPVLLLALLLFAACQNPSGDSEEEDSTLRGTVSISGRSSLGGTLEADTSALEGTGTILYQWFRGESTPLEGAAAESYVPVAGDVGKTLKAQVRRIGYTGIVESEAVGPISQSGFNYILASTVKYFSLSKSMEVSASKRATAEWDIALESKSGFIYAYTNSGVTAAELGSGGKGGVWFVGDDAKPFNDVTLADRVTEYTGENAQYADCKDYETDVTRYQIGMSAALPGRMNIMTYYGYAVGDGLTADTAFGWSTPGPPNYPFYEFNKKAIAYVEGGMPPPWYPTGRVYIIRHGDGEHYSKFQIDTLSYIRGYKFNISFKFSPLSE
jgi:hypothetical protein